MASDRHDEGPWPRLHFRGTICLVGGGILWGAMVLRPGVARLSHSVQIDHVRLTVVTLCPHTQTAQVSAELKVQRALLIEPGCRRSGCVVGGRLPPKQTTTSAAAAKNPVQLAPTNERLWTGECDAVDASAPRTSHHSLRRCCFHHRLWLFRFNLITIVVLTSGYAGGCCGVPWFHRDSAKIGTTLQSSP